jgi:beta-galactosidase/beta-glucuronidase
MVRQRWKNLNGVWQFAVAKRGEAPPVGQSLSERILVPFPVESALSGIKRHESRMFYRRTFTVTASWHVTGSGCVQRRGAGADAATSPKSCQRLLLHFGAVDWRTAVWINGQKVGTHRGGYDRFTFDITPALNAHGKQEIIVGVYDPTEKGGQPIGKQRNAAFHNPHGIVYTPSSGIWQTVWLEPVSQAYIEHLDMIPDLDNNTLQLTVHAAHARGKIVKAAAYDGHQQVGSIAGPANRTLHLRVKNPKLWSPSHPFLYHLKVRLLDKRGAQGSDRQGQKTKHTRLVDTVKSYFGMRSIGIEKIKGAPRIVLNGKFLFEFGPLDQGFWPDGIYTAPTDAALKYDLQKEKQLGYNMVRKHMKVEPARWYYYADKLGLLVWQDMPAMREKMPAKRNARRPSDGARQEFVKELHRMVEQHRSHPSIVMWVPFNEGWGEFDPKRITNLIEKWDPSRLVDSESGTNCCASFGVNSGDAIDNHTYAGPGAPRPSNTRAAVDGEYGGLWLKVKGHLFAPQQSRASKISDRKTLTDRYVELAKKVKSLEIRCGLSAAVYTEITDIEAEMADLMTYDRRVVKVNPSRARRSNRAVIAASRRVKNFSAKQSAHCDQHYSGAVSRH